MNKVIFVIIIIITIIIIIITIIIIIRWTILKLKSYSDF